MSLVEELIADLEFDNEDLKYPEGKQEDDMETENVKPSKLELDQRFLRLTLYLTLPSYTSLKRS